MNEPILIGLTPAAIAAAVAILANFGKAWFNIDISQAQLDSLNQLLVLLVGILGVIGAWWAREHSTPVANPTLPSGTVVNVVTPPGQANTTTTL